MWGRTALILHQLLLLHLLPLPLLLLLLHLHLHLLLLPPLEQGVPGCLPRHHPLTPPFGAHPPWHGAMLGEPGRAWGGVER